MIECPDPWPDDTCSLDLCCQLKADPVCSVDVVPSNRGIVYGTVPETRASGQSGGSGEAL